MKLCIQKAVESITGYIIKQLKNTWRQKRNYTPKGVKWSSGWKHFDALLYARHPSLFLQIAFGLLFCFWRWVIFFLRHRKAEEGYRRRILLETGGPLHGACDLNSWA
jgi:hypothetical protein